MLLAHGGWAQQGTSVYLVESNGEMVYTHLFFNSNCFTTTLPHQMRAILSVFKTGTHSHAGNCNVVQNYKGLDISEIGILRKLDDCVVVVVGSLSPRRQ